MPIEIPYFEDAIISDNQTISNLLNVYTTYEKLPRKQLLSVVQNKIKNYSMYNEYNTKLTDEEQIEFIHLQKIEKDIIALNHGEKTNTTYYSIMEAIKYVLENENFLNL